MSSSDTVPPSLASDVVPPVEAQHPEWLEHMQRARPRHGAITLNLHTLSSYKNWADEMRGSWEPGAESGEIEARPLGSDAAGPVSETLAKE